MDESASPPLSSTERAIVASMLAFAGDEATAEHAALKTRLEALVQEAGHGRVMELVERLRTTGAEFTYYPPNALARQIHHAIGETVLGTKGGLSGAENLAGLESRPVLFVQNHLSYSDANVLSVLLDRAHRSEFADRLTVIAGPKVYSDPLRRFSSLCFGTVKTPQSTDLASDEAVMSVRDVARLARETIRIAMERQRGGDALLVFAEGTRSRTGEMQRTLAAVTRYFENEDTVLVPVGVNGSERFIPVDDERIHHADVEIVIGRGTTVSELSRVAKANRRVMMDAVGLAIAPLLPPAYRGFYAEDAAGLADARRVAAETFFSGKTP